MAGEQLGHPSSPPWSCTLCPPALHVAPSSWTHKLPPIPLCSTCSSNHFSFLLIFMRFMPFLLVAFAILHESSVSFLCCELLDSDDISSMCPVGASVWP